MMDFVIMAISWVVFAILLQLKPYVSESLHLWGRWRAEGVTERAFCYKFLPSQSACADSSPKGRAL